MKIEDQVCSLELAKKLKELGVKQESFCFWYKNYSPDWQLRTDRDCLGEYWGGNLIYSAFTVAELGAILPMKLKYKGMNLILQSNCKNIVAYRIANDLNSYILHQIQDTEANARAKMLIYLLENKLVTLN